MNRRDSDQVAPRKKKRISCELRCGDRRHSGIVLDLSRSGLFVQTNAKPRPGSEVEIEFKVPGLKSALALRGRVARAKLVPPQLLSVAQGGLGLTFRSPPAAYLEFIENLEKPVEIERKSIPKRPAAGSKPQPKSASGPGTKSGKPVSKAARDRLAALRQRSASAAGGRAAPSPREKPGARARFRVELRQAGSSASRSVIVRCGGESEARERARAELGGDWKVVSVERL